MFIYNYIDLFNKQFSAIRLEPMLFHLAFRCGQAAGAFFSQGQMFLKGCFCCEQTAGAFFGETCVSGKNCFAVFRREQAAGFFLICF